MDAPPPLELSGLSDTAIRSAAPFARNTQSSNACSAPFTRAPTFVLPSTTQPASDVPHVKAARLAADGEQARAVLEAHALGLALHAEGVALPLLRDQVPDDDVRRPLHHQAVAARPDVEDDFVPGLAFGEGHVERLA